MLTLCVEMESELSAYTVHALQNVLEALGRPSTARRRDEIVKKLCAAAADLGVATVAQLKLLPELEKVRWATSSNRHNDEASGKAAEGERRRKRGAKPRVLDRQLKGYVSDSDKEEGEEGGETEDGEKEEDARNKTDAQDEEEEEVENEVEGVEVEVDSDHGVRQGPRKTRNKPKRVVRASNESDSTGGELEKPKRRSDQERMGRIPKKARRPRRDRDYDYDSGQEHGRRRSSDGGLSVLAIKSMVMDALADLVPDMVNVGVRLQKNELWQQATEVFHELALKDARTQKYPCITCYPPLLVFDFVSEYNALRDAGRWLYVADNAARDEDKLEAVTKALTVVKERATTIALAENYGWDVAATFASNRRMEFMNEFETELAAARKCGKRNHGDQGW